MRIAKKYSFDSAHLLPRHPGKCGRLHGHTYVIEVRIEGGINKETQFVLDYNDLDSFMKPLIEKLDHQYLNDFIAYPSAENIATSIGAYVIKQLEQDVKVSVARVCISVSETPKTIAIWDSDNGEDIERLDDPDDTQWLPPSNIAIPTQQLITHLTRKIEQKMLDLQNE